MGKCIIHFLWGAFFIIIIRVVFSSGNNNGNTAQVKHSTTPLPTAMNSEGQTKKFYPSDLIQFNESSYNVDDNLSSMAYEDLVDTIMLNDVYVHSETITNTLKNAGTAAYFYLLDKNNKPQSLTTPTIMLHRQRFY